MSSLSKAAIAELLGTFTLVFVGMLAGSAAPSIGPIAPALGHGLVLVGIIFVYGHISGAHVNPAVTLGLLVGGKVKIDKAVVYWIAQFVGAILAAVVVNMIIADGAIAGQTKGSLTDASVGSAALLEAILTFFLVTAVYQAAVYGKAGNGAAVAIGLTLAAAIIAGGALTGASLNPARTLGPALIAGDLSYTIPYFIGIFAGGAVGGLLNAFILTPEKD